MEYLAEPDGIRRELFSLIRNGPVVTDRANRRTPAEASPLVSR